MLMDVLPAEGITGWRYRVFFKGVTGLGTLRDDPDRVDLVRGLFLGDPVARIKDTVYGRTREAAARHAAPRILTSPTATSRRARAQRASTPPRGTCAAVMTYLLIVTTSLPYCARAELPWTDRRVIVVSGGASRRGRRSTSRGPRCVSCMRTRALGVVRPPLTVLFLAAVTRGRDSLREMLGGPTAFWLGGGIATRMRIFLVRCLPARGAKLPSVAALIRSST